LPKTKLSDPQNQPALAAWYDAVALDSELPHPACRVACVVAAIARRDGGEAFVSALQFSKMIGVSGVTIRASLAALEARGYIKITRRRGRGLTNSYTIRTPEVVARAMPARHAGLS
jgi:hypothetical protein